MRLIYFDNAATTPLDERVFEEMKGFLLHNYGNASSIHTFGRKARAGVDKSREIIAKMLNVQESEIYFTSGGTESNNLAIKGIAHSYQDKGNHIITSSVEHPSVLNTCRFLESQGFKVTYLPVDGFGMVDPSDVRKAISKNTIIVSIMHANNEVGTINDIDEIGKITKEFEVLFHTDAVQTFGKLPIDVNKIGVDILSLSAHKIYGPKGIGGLYVRKGIKIQPQQYGGGQERNKRSGTENVPNIVGFRKAVEIRGFEMENEYKYLTKLEKYFKTKLSEKIDNIFFNTHPERKLPGYLNISFSETEGESLLLSLDLEGIAVATGSACSSGSIEPSYVLLAMGLSPERIQSSIRITMGKQNSNEDIDYALEVFPKVVKRLRELSTVSL
jgi:cysteine desulfurase